MGGPPIVLIDSENDENLVKQGKLKKLMKNIDNTMYPIIVAC